MYCLVLLSALFVCAAGVPLSNTKPRLDGRIMGGIGTDITKHPHQVSVEVDRSHICGGIIIRSRWVITSAFCVDRSPLSAYTVRSGSTFSNIGGEVHNITRIIIHPNYNSFNMDFDVALLQVWPAFRFSNVRQPIPLRCVGVPIGTNVLVSGWGAIFMGGPNSTTLLEMNLRTVSNAACNRAYAPWASVTPRMICTGLPGWGSGPCLGDNGGPLITTNPRSLVGIISWGFGCVGPDLPAVFTRVSTVCVWILRNAV